MHERIDKIHGLTHKVKLRRLRVSIHRGEGRIGEVIKATRPQRASICECLPSSQVHDWARRKNLGKIEKVLVYTVGHKLLEQVTPKVWSGLKLIKVQRRHNIFTSGRGTMVYRE